MLSVTKIEERGLHFVHVFAPDSYIRELGGLVVIDEVQTGLGRVGAYTWGFQAS
jgi:hypothetical protein